jgi:hypothetical protein
LRTTPAARDAESLAAAPVVEPPARASAARHACADTLELLGAAGAPVLKRLAPVLALLVVAAAFVARRSSRKRRTARTGRVADRVSLVLVGARHRGGLMTDYSARMPWTERAAQTLGHHAGQVLMAAILAMVGLRFYPLSAWLVLAASVILVCAVLLAWLLMRQHDRHLCERCVRSMPLNPSEEALRLRRRFWLAHTAAQPRFLIPYLVVLVGSNFATSTAGKIAWAVIQLSMIYLIIAHATHRRLQPWCPWCSPDGGGDLVANKDPVPPHDDRQPV